MRLVVDASAILATVLPEHNRHLRDATAELLARYDIAAPAVWQSEVVGGLAKAEWMQRISSDTCELIWSKLHAVLLAVDPARPAPPSEVLAVCRRYALRGADATYLELALREGIPLLTGDVALAQAARAAHVELAFDPI